MSRLPTYTKKVACLEGDWDNWKDDNSVLPALQLLRSSTGAPFLHRRCTTQDEFAFYLNKIGRSTGFPLVYLAFHGAPGQIETERMNLSLEELADLMGKRFRRRVLHFGSCATLQCSDSRLEGFVRATEVSLVTGFTRTVEWVESTAFDLIYLGLWQEYKQVAAFDSRLRTAYPDLTVRLGYRSMGVHQL